MVKYKSNGHGTEGTDDQRALFSLNLSICFEDLRIEREDRNSKYGITYNLQKFSITSYLTFPILTNFLLDTHTDYVDIFSHLISEMNVVNLQKILISAQHQSSILIDVRYKILKYLFILRDTQYHDLVRNFIGTLFYLLRKYVPQRLI